MISLLLRFSVESISLQILTFEYLSCYFVKLIFQKIVKLCFSFSVAKKYMGKKKPPNLLTWMEKQIIIKLHKEDPISWNSEGLSECFPITPHGVEKLVKKHRKRLPWQIKKES